MSKKKDIPFLYFFIKSCNNHCYTAYNRAVAENYSYLVFEYVYNSCLKLLRVVEVYCSDMGFADVLFSVRMLR